MTENEFDRREHSRNKPKGGRTRVKKHTVRKSKRFTGSGSDNPSNHGLVRIPQDMVDLAEVEAGESYLASLTPGDRLRIDKLNPGERTPPNLEIQEMAELVNDAKVSSVRASLEIDKTTARKLVAEADNIDSIKLFITSEGDNPREALRNPQKVRATIILDKTDPDVEKAVKKGKVKNMRAIYEAKDEE